MTQSDAGPTLEEAVAFVIEIRKCSTSAVQRRFKIAYHRAATLIEEMEALGVVSTADQNGRRVVLDHQ